MNFKKKIEIYMKKNEEINIKIKNNRIVILSNFNQDHYEKIIKKAKKIKFLLVDCDGVMTDGGMYYTEDGGELKKFNTRDGMGISLLREKGIIVGIITGERLDLIRRRAEKLGVEELFMGINNKMDVLNKILEKYNTKYEEIAYIGDDLNDLDIIKKVGLSFCVKDAVEKIKKLSDFIIDKNGGEGAIREVAEIILNAQKIKDK